jgi:NAD(P)-dependent dehydrogenase (short-subunit alcohol dehydrogenase family)
MSNAKNPGQKFGRRSTAEQVSEGIDLAGIHAIVTGANTGIGKETSRVLALRGAEVTMACRNGEKAAEARQQILDSAGERIPKAGLRLLQLDLADLASVRRAAGEVLATDRPIHLLINNAGIMIPDRRETKDGFEAHFGTNHLGHFLFTNLLLDRIRASAPARIINVSSDALHFASLTPHLDDVNWTTRRWSGWRSYGDSKLMNLVFSRELTRRYGADGVVAHALHPGIVATELARDQGLVMKIVGLLMLPALKSAARGAATSVWAATAPELATQGGGYFSDCSPARTHKLADDLAFGEKLWKRSEELTGASV